MCKIQLRANITLTLVTLHLQYTNISKLLLAPPAHKSLITHNLYILLNTLRIFTTQTFTKFLNCHVITCTAILANTLKNHSTLTATFLRTFTLLLLHKNTTFLNINIFWVIINLHSFTLINFQTVKTIPRKHISTLNTTGSFVWHVVIFQKNVLGTPTASLSRTTQFTTNLTRWCIITKTFLAHLARCQTTTNTLQFTVRTLSITYCTRRQLVPNAFVHNRHLLLCEVHHRLDLLKEFHAQDQGYWTIQ